MLTECPSCLTVFRVTGAILKMGHGQVRCGKCRTQFDALDSLLDDVDDSNADAKPTATQDAAAPVRSTEAPAIEAHAPDIAEEITLEGSRIEISGTYRVAAVEAHDDSEATPEQLVREHVVIDRDESFADNVQDDNAPLDAQDEEQFIEIGLDDGEPVAEAANHLLSDTAAPLAEESVPFSHRIWKRTRQQKDLQRNVANRQIAAELDALTQLPAPPPVKRAGQWTAAAIVLAFVLIAQVVHHYRDPLVRDPKWGPIVSRVYRSLGFSLTPHWDLRSYKLLQWGVIPGGGKGDELRLRASVTNGAAFTQPYPFIKLIMKDRYEAPVAMREFAPEEYLPSAAANRMMAPKQRATADIVFVDPGADAVGFNIHACLPQNNGLICDDDLPQASGSSD